MASLSELWWTSQNAIIKYLHACSVPAARDAAQKSLEAQLDWLKNGVTSFRRPNPESAHLINEAKPVTMRGKKYVIESRLKSETLKLSKLLDLDELQTHILLRRWLKESGSEPSVLQGVPPGTDALLPLTSLQEVVAYYHQERLLLVKSLQFVVLKGTSDEFFAGLAARLAAAGHMEQSLMAALRTNLQLLSSSGNRWASSNSGGGAAEGAGGGSRNGGGGVKGGSGGGGSNAAKTIAERMAVVTQEYGAAGNTGWQLTIHQMLREHVLQERCELLALLVLLYRMGVAPAPDPARVLELVTLFGGALWPSPGGAGSANAADVNAAEFGPGEMPYVQQSQGETALMSEYLASLLVLTALDPPSYVALARRDDTDAQPAGSSGRAAGGDGGLPLGSSKMREIHSQIRSWAAAPSNVSVLLTWSAIVRLSEDSIDLGETAVEDLQAAAFRAGGLDALSALLETEALAVSGACAQVYRQLLAEAVSLVATVFDLGTSQLSAPLFESLLRLVKLLLAGNVRLCADVWDEDVEHFAALRALLDDAAALFPALLGPYLQLLVTLAQGPASAARSYRHLQTACSHLVCLHDVTDPTVRHEADGTVTPAVRPLRWNRAPNVPTMGLPEEGVGRVSLLPAVLSHLEGRQQLVVWDVCGTHPSFGQLLLLGRAAQCLVALQPRGAAAVPPDSVEVQDLRDILQLLATVTRHCPSLVPDLVALSVEVDVGGGLTASRSWLDVAAAAVALLCEAPLAVVASGSAAHALQLLAALAQFHPTRVLEALQVLAPFSVQVEGGSSATYALSSLPQLDVGKTGLLAGLLPGLRAFQAGVEAPSGRYPVTAAFLQALAALLQQGFGSGPMPAYVMYCLHELLPQHQQWRYSVSADRWALTAAVLRVVRLAVEAGMFVEDVDHGAAAGGFKPTVHVTAVAAHILQQLLLHGPSMLPGVLMLPHAEVLDAVRGGGAQAGEVEAAEAAAAELLQLLAHAAAAARFYPAPLPLEEWLLQGGASGAAGPLSSSSSSAPTVSEVLFSYVAYGGGGADDDGDADGGGGGDAAVSGSLPCLALRCLHAFLRALSRPGLSDSDGAGPAAAALLPRGSAAEQAFHAFFDPTSPTCRPPLLAAAADVLVAATVAPHPGILDALLFPTSLSMPSTDSGPPLRASGAMNSLDSGMTAAAPAAGQASAGSAAAAAAGSKAAAEGAGGADGAKGAAGKGDATAAGGPGSVLDGLWALVQQAEQLRQDQPEVLAHTLRCVVALWQCQPLVYRAVALLRGQDGWWDAILRAALSGAAAGAAGTAAGAAAAAADTAAAEMEGGAEEVEDGSAAGAWRTYCQACVWQLLAIEGFASPRTNGSGRDASVWATLEKAAVASPLASAAATPSTPSVFAGATASAAAAGGVGTPVSHPLLDAMRCYARPALRRDVVGRLAGRLQAAYLELGVVALGGLLLPKDTTEAREDLVAVAAQLKQELSPLCASLEAGAISRQDVEDAHSFLLEADGGGGNDDDDAIGTWEASAPPRVAAGLLQRPLGRTLLAHSRPPEAVLQDGTAPCYGVRFVVASDRLLQLLGPAGGDIGAAAELVESMNEFSLQASLTDARLTALQSSAALLAVVLNDAKLRTALLNPSSPSVSHTADAAGGGTAFAAAVSCSSASVDALLQWGDGAPDAAAVVLQPQFGLSGTLQCHVLAAATSCRLLVQVVHSIRSKSSFATTGSTAAAAAPSSQSPQQPRRSTGGGAATAATTASPLGAAVAVVGLMSRWLRALDRAETAEQCGSAAVKQITDALCGAALVALQCAPPAMVADTSSPAASANMELQVALLDVMPRLCAAASSGASESIDALAAADDTPPIAMQLLLEVFGRHLPPSDWLPFLRTHLDISALLQHTARRVPAYVQQPGGPTKAQELSALGDVGLLQLALAVAQLPEGARLLHDQGALQQLAAMSRHLLSPNGGMLAAFSADDTPHHSSHGPSGSSRQQRPASSAAAVLPAAADLGGCYFLASGAPSPVHQQWCVLLALAAALLRTLSQLIELESSAIELLSAAEPRLLLCCQRPAADARQPLTAAQLQELQRALFLLSHMARHAGAWHLMLPGSLLNFRSAVSSFVGFAAQPGLVKKTAAAAVSVCCPPQSAAEKALLRTPSGVPNAAGWFRLCSQGSGEGDAAAKANSAAPAAAGGTPDNGQQLVISAVAGGTASGTPGLFSSTPGLASSSILGGGGRALVVSTGADNNGAVPPAAATCSEYSARLAESMYTAVHHALVFLVATSPQVSEGEASSLGPSWPKPRELLALQEQCMSVVQHWWGGPAAGGAAAADAGKEEARRRRVFHVLLQVLRLTGDFLDLMGVRRREEAVRECAALLEHYLATGAMPAERSPAPPPPLLSWSSLSSTASEVF